MKTRKNNVRSIATAPPPKPKHSAAEIILRDLYDEAKANADGGLVLFYIAGDFVVFLEDAVKVGRTLGVIPAPFGGEGILGLGLEGSHIEWIIQRLRLAGHKDIWIWNRLEGVRPVIPGQRSQADLDAAVGRRLK